MNRSTLLSLLTAGFFTLVALLSLIKTPFYTSHDGFVHTTRIAAYYRTIKDGQFPPRWATNLNAAMGSPIFTYIYPLPYFLGGVFHLVKFSYQDSFRLVMITSTLASAVFMFWWLKENFGNLAALVGAVYYVWVPYRFLNLYVRAAYAENLAYAFIPLVLLSVQKIYQSKKANLWQFLLAFSTTALLLSHNEIAAISLPVAFGWALLWVFLTRKWNSLIRVCLFFLAGFLMASFIYLPDFLERKYIFFDRGMAYYFNYFVAWWQLLRSPWGYGFDLGGTLHDGMSLQLGLAQIFSVIVSTAMIGWTLIRNRGRKISLQTWTAIFFLAILGIVIFFMVDQPYIRRIWEVLPLITIIVDFPWRFLGTASLAVAFLTAFVTNRFKFPTLAAVILIAFTLVANRNHLRINQSLSIADPVFDAYRGTSTAASNEFTPAWHQSAGFVENSSPVSAIYGSAKLSGMTNNAFGTSFSVEVAGPAAVRINRFYFPQTDIYSNNNLLVKDKDWNIINVPTTPNYDDTGLILLKIFPPGGNYVLKFGETPLRRTADFISLATFIIMALFFIKSFKWKRKSII